MLGFSFSWRSRVEISELALRGRAADGVGAREWVGTEGIGKEPIGRDRKGKEGKGRLEREIGGRPGIGSDLFFWVLAWTGSAFFAFK